MKRFPLFWKFYLALLAVLFLPAFAVYFFDRWSENDTIRRVEAESEARQLQLALLTREMAEEIEELIDRSPSDDNRETILSWVERQNLGDGLDLYISLPGPKSPDFFSLRVQESGVRIAPPLTVMVRSTSGRVTLSAVQEPYQDWDELRTPLPVKLFLLMTLLGTAVSYFAVRHLMVPLRELEGATARIAQGDFSVRVGDASLARGDELQRLGGAFNTMASQVEMLLENQKRLLGDISHELRSPLHRLAFSLALIERSGEGHLDEASMEQAKRDVWSINAMVDELLVLTRSESSTGVEMERVELKKLVTTLLETEKLEWSENGKSVEFQGEEVCVLGDQRLLSRAIRNLIHNAVRYSPEGGKVEVSLACEGSEAVLRVRDHGRGVAEEEQEKIFLPFYRTESARERISGGTGLGLPIVRRVAERHGGSCVATNVSDGGLLMTLYLPSCQPPNQRKMESPVKLRTP